LIAKRRCDREDLANCILMVTRDNRLREKLAPDALRFVEEYS
jgi:hypothetical protein